MEVDLDPGMRKGGDLESTNRMHEAVWFIIIY